jgi:hypothetical protein
MLLAASILLPKEQAPSVQDSSKPSIFLTKYSGSLLLSSRVGEEAIKPDRLLWEGPCAEKIIHI